MKTDLWKQRLTALVVSLIFPAVFLLLQLLVGAVLSFMAGIMAAAELMAFGSTDETAMVNLALEYVNQNMLVASAASGLMTVGLIALWQKLRGRPVMRALRLRPVPVRQSLCSLGLGAGMYSTVSLLLSVIPFPESMVQQYNELVAQQTTLMTSPLMSVVALVLVAPLAEELTFRGMCGGALEKAFPAWAVILWQGAVFALVHLVPYQIIYVFPVGIVLGVLYHRTKSMLAPILMHAVFNALGVITGQLDPAVLSSPAVSSAMLAGPILVVVCLVALYRTQPEEQEE